MTNSNDTDWSNYENIVGKKWDYYRPRFERFAHGGWLDWNWAAFFGTLAWLRYRKLYGWSWLYFFVSTPFLLSILLLTLPAVDACEQALSPAPFRIDKIIISLLFIMNWFIPPLIANRLYYNEVAIAVEKNTNRPGTGGYAGALGLQFLVLCFAAVTGPTTANYTYRVMVSEGVSLASAARTAVSEYVVEHGKLPERLEDLFDPTSGKYVNRMVLESDGTILAYFGEGAKKLSRHSIAFVPTGREGDKMTWACRSTDLPKQCLPSRCRATAGVGPR